MDDSGGNFEALSSIQPNVRHLDPFWATRLWQRLVKEAALNVRICRQRHFLKSYENVFNGEDLVNLIYNFLKDCDSELDVKQIERSNAVKVCQVLMEKKMFESVFPKGSTKFEDSSHRFFRFTEDHVPEVSAVNTDEKENYRFQESEYQKVNILSPCADNSTVFSPSRLEFSRLSSARQSSKRCTFRIKTPLLKVRDTKPSPVRFSKRNARDSDHEDSLLPLRETALALLLQLTDIPVLESLLTVPSDLSELPEAPQPYILENDFTPRKINPFLKEICSPVVNLPWIQAASACLGGGYPPGIAGLWSVQACKKLCYQAVTDRFSYCAEALLPGQYFPICISIVNMLKEYKQRQALYALQLLVIHLPCRRRKQLQHLLCFLHLVVEDLFVSVDKKVTNYEAILRDFLYIVFRHPLISKESQKILFDYLLLKSDAIFLIPPRLQQAAKSGLGFCKKISMEEFNTTSMDFTKECLHSLSSAVIDSTQLKLADKKNWLKKFKKCHQEIYDTCHYTE